MKSRILLFSLSNSDNDGNTEIDGHQFIHSVIHSTLNENYELHLALARHDSLATDTEALGIPVHIIKSNGGLADLKNKHAIIEQLQNLHTETPFDIVHTHSTLDHHAACLWKQRHQPLSFIVHTRYQAEKIRETASNKVIHNKLTAVNVILGRELEQQLRGKQATSPLHLDNPFVIDESPTLSDYSLEMLEHCYLSLKHSISGKINDWSHIRLTYVIHFYLNQGDSAPVIDLLRKYEGFSAGVLDRIHFVIVDDGSPLDVPPPELALNFTWLKINEDIRWNQGGSRNLAVTYARSDNLLLSDLDLEFSEETLRALVNAKPCGRNFYKFRLLDPGTGITGKGHPNTFLISRARFLRHGGYDEEFCGHYGTEDFRFVKYQKAQGSRQLYFDKRHVCMRRTDINREKQYHSLYRDLSFNTPVDARKKFEMETYGHEAGASRTFLNFTWQQRGENRRDVRITRKVDRWWKRRWLLRWLLGVD